MEALTIENKQPKRGRPRKYSTKEEAIEAQLQQIKAAYVKKKPEGYVKPSPLTAEEIREKQRMRLKRFRDKKKVEKSCDNIDK